MGEDRTFLRWIDISRRHFEQFRAKPAPPASTQTGLIRSAAARKAGHSASSRLAFLQQLTLLELKSAALDPEKLPAIDQASIRNPAELGPRPELHLSHSVSSDLPRAPIVSGKIAPPRHQLPAIFLVSNGAPLETNAKYCRAICPSPLEIVH